MVGLGYQVTDQKEIALPPYEGSLRLAGTDRGGLIEGTGGAGA